MQLSEKHRPRNLSQVIGRRAYPDRWKSAEHNFGWKLLFARLPESVQDFIIVYEVNYANYRRWAKAQSIGLAVTVETLQQYRRRGTRWAQPASQVPLSRIEVLAAELHNGEPTKAQQKALDSAIAEWINARAGGNEAHVYAEIRPLKYSLDRENRYGVARSATLAAPVPPESDEAYTDEECRG